MTTNAVTLRRTRIGLVIGAIALVALVLWLARGALFPFLLGGIIAYVLAPLVERLASIQPWYGRHPGIARGSSILAIYCVFGSALIVLIIFAVPTAVDEVGDLIDAVPDLSRAAQARIDGWIERYNREVPEEVRGRINQGLEQMGSEVTRLVEGLLTRSVGVVFSTVATLVGYVAVPFFVFYVLKDRDYALGRFYGLFPRKLQPDVRECVRIADRVLGAYIRGQLLLGLVIFLITFIGLRVMGVEFSFALAVVAGITELIPIIGPVLGAIPAIIVVLATEPDHWWWVVLFYLGVQVAENYLLVPRVHSRTVSMHPAIILILLTVGGSLFGILGLLLAVPVAATARDLFTYIHGRLKEAETEAAPERA